MQSHRISSQSRPSGMPGLSNPNVGNSGSGGGISTSSYGQSFNLSNSTNEQIPIGDQLMQVDQAITLTLQEIDANFAKTHQIITGKILPMIKRYGIASHNTWQGAKFWHKFFEAASDIQLAPPREESTFVDNQEEESGDGIEGTDTMEGGIEEEEDQHEFQDDTSFQTLTHSQQKNKQNLDDSYDIQESSGELRSSHFEPPRVSDASIAATARLSRNALAAANGDESDDINYTHRSKSLKIQATPRRESSKKNPFAKSQERNQNKVSSSSSNQSEINAAVDKRKATSPRWNGIADLRKTPLSHVNRSPVRKSGQSGLTTNKKGKQTEKGDGEDEDEDSLAWPAGMSPPVTMQFSVPRSRYNKTPAKEAARLVVDDLLRTVEGATPAARRRLMEERRSANERGLSANIPSNRISREQSSNLAGTPLGTGKRRPNKGRTSMPTPPTVTKRVGGTVRISNSTQRESTPKISSKAEKFAPSTASRLMDEDEEGQSLADESGQYRSNERGLGDLPEDLGTGLSRLALSKAGTAEGMDRLFEEQIGDEDDSDNDMEDTDSEEEDEEYNSNAIGRSNEGSKQRHTKESGAGASHTSSSLASVSHSIDEDTLFGIRDPSLRAAQRSAAKVGKPLNSTRSNLSQNAKTSLNRIAGHQSTSAAGSIPAATPSTRMYKPMGQVANLGTVYRGRPLLGNEERDDTYSAPSPTPASLADGRSAFRRPT